VSQTILSRLRTLPSRLSLLPSIKSIILALRNLLLLLARLSPVASCLFSKSEWTKRSYRVGRPGSLVDEIEFVIQTLETLPVVGKTPRWATENESNPPLVGESEEPSSHHRRHHYYERTTTTSSLFANPHTLAPPRAPALRTDTPWKPTQRQTGNLRGETQKRNIKYPTKQKRKHQRKAAML